MRAYDIKWSVANFYQAVTSEERAIIGIFLRAVYSFAGVHRKGLTQIKNAEPLLVSAKKSEQIPQSIAPEGFAQFSAPTYSVSSTARSATIVLTRIAGDSGPARVAYSTSDGTAQAGVQYSATTGVLDFADGEIF